MKKNNKSKLQSEKWLFERTYINRYRLSKNWPQSTAFIFKRPRFANKATIDIMELGNDNYSINLETLLYPWASHTHFEFSLAPDKDNNAASELIVYAYKKAYVYARYKITSL